MYNDRLFPPLHIWPGLSKQRLGFDKPAELRDGPASDILHELRRYGDTIALLCPARPSVDKDGLLGEVKSE